jgi:multicomponent Na+:H+ antiporter subunit G
MIAEGFALAGALLILVAAVGVTRFDDVLARMHALSKASTLGLVLVLIGGTVGLHRALGDVTLVVLAGVLQVITSPVGANLISRATYRASGIPNRLDAVDELAAEERRSDAHRRPGQGRPPR